MASHLSVDLSVLEQLSRQLVVLRRQFDSSSDIAHAHHASVGSSQVADALDHFAGNWKYHREKLSASIDAIASMAEQGHDTYRAVDEQLAESVRPHGGTGGRRDG